MTVPNQSIIQTFNRKKINFHLKISQYFYFISKLLMHIPKSDLKITLLKICYIEFLIIFLKVICKKNQKNNGFTHSLIK